MANCNVVEQRLMKYIPKAVRPYVVWLDSERTGNHQYIYWLTLEKDGKEYSAEPADSVSELNWNAKQMIPYLNGEKDWID